MEPNFYTSKDKSDNDINLIFFWNRVIRNKKLIGYITLSSFVISLISFIFTKKTWQGQFEIVLASENEKLNAISTKSSLGFGNNQFLNTEVGILKSPSVLMPIFEFVKLELKKKYPNKDELSYGKWKKFLKIKLKKNTSILDITYQDKNKELIIPVLNMMSKEFQVYSGRKKARKIELTKNYLIDQIKIYKVKSAESIRKAQGFAISQDLLINENPINIFAPQSKIDDNNSIQIENFRLRNTTIESLRIRAANQIRNIDEQIIQIEKLDNDPEQLQYIGSTIPALQSGGLVGNLENIETTLSSLRSNYQEKDRQIQSLLVRREFLIELLKKRAIGYLKAQKLTAEAYMQSLIRPEGVILEYKELMREAGRDESTLEALESQLRRIMLEEAKSEDPWKLITKPSILDMPVAPKILYFIFFGMNGGLVLGVAASIFFEKKKGIIFEKEILNEYFPNTLIVNFDKKAIDEKEIKYFNEIIKNSKVIIFNSLLELIDKEIEFIKSKIAKESLEKITEDKIIFTKDFLKKENKEDFRFFVLKINQITYEDLNYILKRIKLDKCEFNAILYVK